VETVSLTDMLRRQMITIGGVHRKPLVHLLSVISLLMPILGNRTLLRHRGRS